MFRRTILDLAVALGTVLLMPGKLPAQDDDSTKPTVQEYPKYVVHFYNTWRKETEFAGEYDTEEQAEARVKELDSHRRSGEVPYIGVVTIQKGTKRVTISPPTKARPVESNPLPPKPVPPGNRALIPIESIKSVDEKAYNDPRRFSLEGKTYAGPFGHLVTFQKGNKVVYNIPGSVLGIQRGTYTTDGSSIRIRIDNDGHEVRGTIRGDTIVGTMFFYRDAPFDNYVLRLR
jgi:hypothetical protein